MQRIHFIAIGGAAMHNLAIAMSKKGYKVTGSDDEIFEPSRSRLLAAGLLPESTGWFPEKITPDIDIVVLGMHARIDNPELQKALSLGLKIMSFPEFLYSSTKEKQRVVVAGSHGKTTTTAMILHALRYAGKEFDYMVGSQIDGFELMADIAEKSDLAVFEGDEYLSSPIDPRSKFLWYKPQIAVITGIEWDHMNVFPTFDHYVQAFADFAQTLPPEGVLFCCDNDSVLKELCKSTKISANIHFYGGLTWEKTPEGSIFYHNGIAYRTNLFGDHNFLNMHAALLVCKQLGVNETLFCKSMESFSGARRRLQKIKVADNPVYYDFAHAPSKVRATVAAVRAAHPDKKIVAGYELHTFSSLSKDFIPLYANTFDRADEVLILFSPEVLQHKRLPMLDPEFVKASVKHPYTTVFTDTDQMFQTLKQRWNNGAVLLLMSSGNFGGVDPIGWADSLDNQ